jgi:ribosome biogenesis GTPase
MQTGAVRNDGAGRHTTTRRELLPIPGGGWLIDTPGLRALGMPGAVGGGDALSVRHAFQDVAKLASHCRFADCAHGSEPGCAVRRAVAEGVVALERVEAWRTLAAESRYQTERWDAALRAERRAAERVGARALRSRLRDKGRG